MAENGVNNMARKKVAIFHCGMIYSGGGERIVLGQMEELKRRGYDAECWVPVLDKQRCYPDLIDEYKIKTFLPQLPHWIPYRHAWLMLATSIMAPFFAWRFRDVDVIIGENQPGLWMAFCISKVLGKKYLGYTCHPNRMVYPRNLTRRDLWKNEPDFLLLSRVLIPFFKPILKVLDQWSFRAAERMLVNGWFIGEEVGKTYGIDWQGCPCGVDLEQFVPVDGKGKFLETEQFLSSLGVKQPYLLFVGRHEVWKRIDLAIRTLKKIRGKLPSIELVIPGPVTSHSKDLKQLANELGLDGAVKLVGTINQQSLRKVFAHASVFVFPSVKEDFGIVMIEARAAGCPVVAWSHGGPTDIVDHQVTGYLAPVEEVDKFASYVVRLLEDERTRLKMGRAARRKVEQKFSWKKHGDLVEEAMAGLL
jgi:glycosyltransferase involved in cell wall biosynthesis